MSLEFLWYVPNKTEPGHRGDTTPEGWGTLDFISNIAASAQDGGFSVMKL